MAALEEYDVNATPGDFDRFQVKDQPAVIQEITVENNSKDDDSKGRGLLVVWKVTGGQNDGRLCYQRIKLWYTGAEKTPGMTRTIAEKEWAEVRAATIGLDTLITDTDQFSMLYERPALITWGPQKNNPDYDQMHKVKPITAGQPARAAPSQQRGPAPGGAKPAAGGSPFGHLKSGAQQQMDDNIPY